MQGLDLRCIAGLEELQSVKISGVSGYRSWRDLDPVLIRPPPPKEEKREHLEAVVELGRQLKELLKQKDRNVDVRVRLIYSDQDEEMVM